MRFRNRKGFSLIELVIVMVVIAVGLLGLSSLFATSTNSLNVNEIQQKATQYAQGCAERALAQRRSSGFNSIQTFTCGTSETETDSSANVLYIFDYSTSVITPTTGGSNYPCPFTTVADCRQINITVTYRGDTNLKSSMSLMLVK